MLDWYSPGEIKFTRDTALWLIQNFGSLRSGHWPHEGTGYVDAVGRRTQSKKALFVTPVEYAAEIAVRLEKCELDGLILLALECWGESEASMGKYFRMPVWSIKKRARLALRYVASGPARRWHDTKKRKAETYREFKERNK